MKTKRIMKKILAVTAVLLLFALSACTPAPEDPNNANDSGKVTEITLWTYPVGGWGKSSTVSSIITAFNNAHSDINLTMETITYEDGDKQVAEAIAKGGLPDLVFEGPERLLASWGGSMVDISDLWQTPTAAKIDQNVRNACHDGEGNYYIYPMCMTTHCMAINRDMFEEAGAWQYVDEQTHTWKKGGFQKAIAALYDKYNKDVAAVYCGGQGGDQGTRALVNNLYGGTFANKDHTAYTVNSQENIKALQLLKSMQGKDISFDNTIVGGDEIKKFCAGELAMAFCWNVSMEVNNIDTIDFDVFPMAFPVEEGTPALQGGIWGFGIFDNGDADRIAAAKKFISYVAEQDYERAVSISSYLPVREMEYNVYENDALMTEYNVFSQYLGDYYQVTLNWANARTAWWQMLQDVGAGEDIAVAVEDFSFKANAAR